MLVKSLTLGLAASSLAAAAPKGTPQKPVNRISRIELGPRPYYLVNNMTEGPLKDKLLSCQENNFYATPWSIGHRGGGTLMFPEETVESIMAGTRMGAAIVECDVTFTSDRELVCRHSQCDLHTTTNIVTIPELNAKCTVPFTPAQNGSAAIANCCTSDITLAEFKSLCGKMDASNPNATTPEEYLDGTPSWRTDLYATCGTVLSHKEYISLVDSMQLAFTPELKIPQVRMPFEGNYTQELFAQQMIDEYKAAGIHPSRVHAQSFFHADLLYWMKAEPEFFAHAILLDQSGDTDATYELAVQKLTGYANDGIKTIAPPLYYLVTVEDGKIVPSSYATKAKELGLNIITWSLERSGPLAVEGHGGYFYTSILNATKQDGDVYQLVDVLAQQVGVKGLFSDWSATATYYANCFGL